MKMIVLVALLATAACGKKADQAAPDCDASIAKAVDASVKARAGGARAEAMAAKFKEALTERCKADKWSSEIVSCFSSATKMQDVQACQAKLSPEQQANLTNELREAMMSVRGVMGQRMPPGVAGHPPMLAGSNAGSAAPPGDPAAGSAAPPAPGGAPPPSGAAAPGASPPPPAAPAPGSPAAPATGSSSK